MRMCGVRHRTMCRLIGKGMDERYILLSECGRYEDRTRVAKRKGGWHHCTILKNVMNIHVTFRKQYSGIHLVLQSYNAINRIEKQNPVNRDRPQRGELSIIPARVHTSLYPLSFSTGTLVSERSTVSSSPGATVEGVADPGSSIGSMPSAVSMTSYMPLAISGAGTTPVRISWACRKC